MATSNRQTFQDVLENGIDIHGQGRIRIDKFFIPRIQRSYAQGRKTEGDVRKNFLKDIFNCLCNNEETVLELSFLFGSKQPSISGGDGFELLDGQQRITTLFLLHWYLWMKEHKPNEAIPECLKQFIYETRDTSTHFIHKIVEKPLVLGNEIPSKVIKARKWFTPIFSCDATVCSMLTMLDAIDEKYKEFDRTDLYGRLNRLQFYVLYLDDFELNDELYIKMNSRGLDLTPFENFKSSLVRYMKDKKGDFVKDVDYKTAAGVETKMPYYLRFSTKMDTVWNDIFWTMPTVPNGDVTEVIEFNNLEKDKSFFRFIIRYFFTKLVLNYKESDYKELEDFFYKNIQEEGGLITAESQYALETRLVGWEYYQKVLDVLGYKGICKLEKVLDAFKNYYNSDIKGFINGNPYKSWTLDVSSEYKNYTLYNRVVFATIVEFIEMIPDGMGFKDSTIQKNLGELFRVMWNVIENTKIEDVKPAISVIRAMSEMIQFSGAIDKGFYEAIAANPITNRNSQLDEEIDKARKIATNVTDRNWENAFINAEKHPFFKGMLRFFYEDSIPTSKDFEDRYNLISTLFDVNGIAQPYRINHILIRALIGKINKWSGDDGLEKKHVTENAEKEGYLKILLGTKGAKELFCGYFSSTFTNIDDYLSDMIGKSTWYNPSEIRLSRVFNRLVNDDFGSGGRRSIELLNKMFDIENRRKKQFYIVDIYGVILCCIPHNERIVLDTERHLIFDELVKDGFAFTNAAQGATMKTVLHDVWGLEVSLNKKIKDSKSNDVTLTLEFGPNKIVNYYVDVVNTDVTPIMPKLESKANNRYQYKYNPPIKYDIFSDYYAIKAEIDRIVDEIGKL